MLERVFDDQAERAPSASVFLLDYLPDFAYDFLVEVDQVSEPYLTISLHIDKNVLIPCCSLRAIDAFYSSIACSVD